MPTEKDILEALSGIIDPDFNKDIVSLGFVQNIRINGGEVSLEIALTTPACPVKNEFQKKAESLLLKLPGVRSVSVHMTTQKLKLQNTPLEPAVPSLNNINAIIAISSCKGGVGKSTVAAHLAQELARRKFNVGLLDCDIHGPSIPTLFNLASTRLQINKEGKLIPVKKNGLQLMSFGFLLGDAPAVMRGPILTRYIQQLIFNTHWGPLDYLFIDMPPGTGDVQLTITQSLRLTGAVIVTTRQTLSLVDVARGILMFEKVKVPILGVIENMSFFLCDNCDKRHFLFGGEKGSTLKERFGIETLAELPLLPQLASSIDKPLVNEYIMHMVDKAVMAIGKNSILKKQIPQIEPKENSLTLRWQDGETISVPFRNLRLSCRCALCMNELTGEKTLKEENIRPDIAPKEIIPLGNYALGITWNDGHASGIYPYEMIKEVVSSKC